MINPPTGYRDEEIPTLDPELLHLLPPFQYGFDLKKKVLPLTV